MARKLICFAILTTTAIVIGCTVKPAIRPAIQDTDIIEAPFDQVWSAIVATLAELDYTIEAIEKESGLITTKPMIFLDGIKIDKELNLFAETPSITLGIWSRARHSINIFATSAGGETTKVKVNVFIEAYDSNQTKSWHVCYSKGVIEQMIFDQIHSQL